MDEIGKRIAELKKAEKKAADYAEVLRNWLIETRRMQLEIEKKIYKTDEDFRKLKEIRQLQITATQKAEELSYEAKKLYGARRLEIVMRKNARKKKIIRRL